MVAPNRTLLDRHLVVQLPSGLALQLSGEALIVPDSSWFDCPVGHFWYWAQAAHISSVPPNQEPGILQVPMHAPAPGTPEEIKLYVRVLELRPDGVFRWRGEWLAGFPKYLQLEPRDALAWSNFVAAPQVQAFLVQAMARCSQLSRGGSAEQDLARRRGSGKRRPARRFVKPGN
jgi:hypothetical protein